MVCSKSYKHNISLRLKIDYMSQTKINVPSETTSEIFNSLFYKCYVPYNTCMSINNNFVVDINLKVVINIQGRQSWGRGIGMGHIYYVTVCS